MDAVQVLFAVSMILFFGFFAEFIFKKFRIPDVLFLSLLGIVLGPHVLDYVDVSTLADIAPIFTTFALLFILYEGSFNIDLAAFASGVSKGFFLSILNFTVSTILILAVMMLAGYSFMTALLVGVILGGISSSFVIPIIKHMKIKPDTYSVLTLESAFTDVFCIVFAITILEIIVAKSASFQLTLINLTTLFATAGFVGILGGILWIFLVVRLFREHKSYMVTLAYLLLLFVITEYLGGNGAIAALFFGLVLRNSKQLTRIVASVKNKESQDHYEGIAVTTKNEQFFYTQLSFFLKTFFFVYIGLLLDFTDMQVVILGSIITVVIMGGRMVSSFLTRTYEPFDRKLINAIFARGLAAAAVVQISIQLGVPYAQTISKIVYFVIAASILLSSIRVFILRVRKHDIDQPPPSLLE